MKSFNTSHIKLSLFSCELQIALMFSVVDCFLRCAITRLFFRDYDTKSQYCSLLLLVLTSNLNEACQIKKQGDQDHLSNPSHD